MIMSSKRPELSDVTECLHCSNHAPMEVLFEHRDLGTDTSGSYQIEHGTIYELLR